MDMMASTPVQEQTIEPGIRVSMNNRTFSDDKFGRREFADQLNQMIQNSNMFKENESFTIAVDASWGMGKTQFLHMWRHMLDELEHPYHSGVIYYNAWENDDCDNALTPLILNICKAYSRQKSEDEKSLDFMRKLLKVGFLATIEMASLAFPPISILKETSKVALETLAEKKAHRAFDMYKNHISAKEEFRDVISSLAGDRKLIIIIDELDRCRPTFAVETLEIAKHFFNIPNVIFVFALDMRQLARSIATTYGQGMDASGYLARFFDVQIQLNYPTAEQYMRCLPANAFPSDANSLVILDQVIRQFSLSAREAIMLLRIFSSFRPAIGIGQHMEYACQFYLVLLAVKYKEPLLFGKILKGDAEALKASRFFMQGTRILEYLQFALDLAPVAINLMDAKLDKIARTKVHSKTGGHVRLLLARYFQKHAMINEPEERLFGTVLHEWMEVFLARGNTPMDRSASQHYNKSC